MSFEFDRISQEPADREEYEAWEREQVVPTCEFPCDARGGHRGEVRLVEVAHFTGVGDLLMKIRHCGFENLCERGIELKQAMGYSVDGERAQ